MDACLSVSGSRTSLRSSHSYNQRESDVDHSCSGKDGHQGPRTGSIDQYDRSVFPDSETLADYTAGRQPNLSRFGTIQLQRVFEEAYRDDLTLCQTFRTRFCRDKDRTGRSSDLGSAQVRRVYAQIHSSRDLEGHEELPTADRPAAEDLNVDIWPRGMSSLECAMDDYGYADSFSEWLDEAGVPRARRACYEGEIASSPLTHIDLDSFLHDYPECKDNFKWILDVGGHITSLKKGAMGPPNKLLEPHVQRLIDLDIAESIPHSCKSRILSGAFCVKKKQPGALRFILNPKGVNKALDGVVIPKCALPSYQTIRNTIMSSEWISQFDFKSFYFQFLLPTEIRNIFGFRVGNRLLRMKRAPMGFKCTPQAGQKVC